MLTSFFVAGIGMSHLVGSFLADFMEIKRGASLEVIFWKLITVGTLISWLPLLFIKLIPKDQDLKRVDEDYNEEKDI